MKDIFGVKAAGSSVKTELYGGIATFLTMAYIIFVNPSVVVNAIPGTASDPVLYNQYFGAIMVATIIASAIGTLLMGLFANYPFALAPGMGLNAYFTYTVCLKLGIDWKVALGAIFMEGLIFILLTVLGVRTKITNAMPKTIKIATGAGIGLFIAYIGLKGAGIVVSDPATFVTLGNMTSPQALTAVFGLIIIAVLFALKVPGSVMIGILAATIFGAFMGITKIDGIVGPIPDISPTFMKLQFNWESIISPTFWMVVLTFFFVDFFDTAGTLTGLGHSAGYTDKEGNLPRSERAYLADSFGTFIGAIFGTSTCTTYIESGAGIAQGARTGLASVFTSAFLLLMVFFSPLAAAIPSAATAPALIFVGSLMVMSLKEIEWEDTTEGLPAFITMVSMPLTYSIATGITLGMIFYPIIKLFTGKYKQVNVMTWILAALFILYLIFLH